MKETMVESQNTQDGQRERQDSWGAGGVIKREKAHGLALTWRPANVPGKWRIKDNLPFDFLRSSRSRSKLSICAVNILATGFTSSSRIRSDLACNRKSKVICLWFESNHFFFFLQKQRRNVIKFTRLLAAVHFGISQESITSKYCFSYLILSVLTTVIMANTKSVPK